MRITGLIFLLFLISCGSRKSKSTLPLYDHYVVGYSYSNFSATKADSAELTNSVCRYLICLDNYNHCLAYRQDSTGVHFYQGNGVGNHASRLKNMILDQKIKHPETINRTNSGNLYCGYDVSLVLENDSVTEYRLIKESSDSMSRLVFDFIKLNNLTETDTNETLLKYKYYILNRVAFSSGIDPVNYRYNQAPVIMIEDRDVYCE